MTAPPDQPENQRAGGRHARKRRAALYLRISKRDGRQTEENQRRQLRAFIEEEGYRLARPDGSLREFVDHESGRKGRRERSGFARMFEAAEQRRFDVLIFWSLDRFSREGIRKTIAYLQQLDALGTGFRSYTEPYLNTENELVRHILLGVLSYLAELEAKKISRRTKAGLERARAEGKELGRPSKFGEYREELEVMLAEGLPKAEMKRRTGLAYNTVKKYLRRIEAAD